MPMTAQAISYFRAKQKLHSEDQETRTRAIVDLLKLSLLDNCVGERARLDISRQFNAVVQLTEAA